jgi:CDP-6-deoxy-D-xylo-4-hexulose-3-dehydrase
MIKDDDIVEEIKTLIKKFYEERLQKKHGQAKFRVPLSIPSFGWEEIFEALDSLLSANVTMGPKVRLFEKLFSEYLGAKHAVMVNSGSSANLLALNILSNPTLEKAITPGDEIIVPAVTWSTTIFPIINIGAVPVLVDVELSDFSININDIEDAITEKTKAIIPVHLLGFPCNMNEVMRLAKKHALFVVEDACEAHGAEWAGKKVGTFGDLGTFSFFFSHHITTIEGGMLLTNDEEYAELARVLRAHGWVRDLQNQERIKKIMQQYPFIDPRFLFINMGFNIRPTEIQGALGIHQIKKLEEFIKIREENAKYWNEELNKFSEFFFTHEGKREARAVWFGYPITVRPDAPFTRAELVRYLESRGIETRPIAAGNMDEQPAMRLFKYRKVGELSNARLIMRNSFFIGNHCGIGDTEREYFIRCLKDFIREKAR